MYLASPLLFLQALEHLVRRREENHISDGTEEVAVMEVVILSGDVFAVENQCQ